MKWIVNGVDRQSGEDRTITIEAIDKQSARLAGNHDGLLVEDVVLLRTRLPSAADVAITRALARFIWAVEMIVVPGGLVIASIWIFAGVYAERNVPDFQPELPMQVAISLLLVGVAVAIRIHGFIRRRN